MTQERGSASAGPLSAYLAERSPDVAAALGSIVRRARALLPGLEEGTSYAMAALMYRGTPLLSVVETAKHLAYYPFSGRAVSPVADDLAGFSLSKGTVRFSLEQPIPADVVDRLILTRRDQIDEKLDR
jgi:uncharacterized protein YdhG (YjbR/CyaY superfamily)